MEPDLCFDEIEMLPRIYDIDKIVKSELETNDIVDISSHFATSPLINVTQNHPTTPTDIASSTENPFKQKRARGRPRKLPRASQSPLKVGTKKTVTKLPKKILDGVEKIQLSQDLCVRIYRPIFSRPIILRRPFAQDESLQVQLVMEETYPKSRNPYSSYLKNRNIQYLTGQDVVDDIIRRMSKANANNVEHEPDAYNPDHGLAFEAYNVDGRTEPEVIVEHGTDCDTTMDENKSDLCFEKPCASSTPIAQSTPCTSSTRFENVFGIISGSFLQNQSVGKPDKGSANVSDKGSTFFSAIGTTDLSDKKSTDFSPVRSVELSDKRSTALSSVGSTNLSDKRSIDFSPTGSADFSATGSNNINENWSELVDQWQSSSTTPARPASLKVELYETEANSSHPHELETNSSYLQSIGLVDLDVLKDFEVKASEPFELTEFTSVPVYISDMQLSLPDDTSGLQTSNQLVEVALLTNSPTVNTVDNQTYKLVPNGEGFTVEMNT